MTVSWDGCDLDLQVAPILPTKFQVNWPFASGEEVQNRFLRKRPSWTADPKILAIFDLKVAPILPTKCLVY